DAQSHSPSSDSRSEGSSGAARPEGLDLAADVFTRIQRKVDLLVDADQENERLVLENAHLRLKLEASEFDCSSRNSDQATRQLAMRLNQETGSKVGQTLATISYKPPGHLPPEQLYTLAVSYLRGREDEKAAVLFTFLTGLEENDFYKTPKNYL